eukprot:TRINITY_DN1831_c0_g2_i2.p2 TRINITY_DN1831_c0_g2~~TRINITY_DN1831_c0_g2_i2.p2  ORF type:complete len:109 (-),score=11.10 TRINITY_DN1831_c0_g2_i2:483-809(-)
MLRKRSAVLFTVASIQDSFFVASKPVRKEAATNIHKPSYASSPQARVVRRKGGWRRGRRRNDSSFGGAYKACENSSRPSEGKTSKKEKVMCCWTSSDLYKVIITSQQY